MQTSPTLSVNKAKCLSLSSVEFRLLTCIHFHAFVADFQLCLCSISRYVFTDTFRVSSLNPLFLKHMERNTNNGCIFEKSLLLSKHFHDISFHRDKLPPEGGTLAVGADSSECNIMQCFISLTSCVIFSSMTSLILMW